MCCIIAASRSFTLLHLNVSFTILIAKILCNCKTIFSMSINALYLLIILFKRNSLSLKTYKINNL